MSQNAADYLGELKARLQNPAISDTDLLTYIHAAFRDVSPALYAGPDYDAQILDTACLSLSIDGKFPEVSSISGGGVTTSFSPNDPERFRRRIRARRTASWMGR